MGLILKKKAPSKISLKTLKQTPYQENLWGRMRLVVEKDDPKLESSDAKNYITGLMKPGSGDTQVDVELRALWDLLDRISHGEKKPVTVLKKALTL